MKKNFKNRMKAIFIICILCISLSLTAYAENTDAALLVYYGIPEATLEAMPTEVQHFIAEALRDDPTKVSIASEHFTFDENVNTTDSKIKENTREIPGMTLTLVAVDGSGVGGNPAVHYTINVSYTWDYNNFCSSYEDMLAASWGGTLSRSATSGISRYYNGGSSVGMFAMQLNSSFTSGTHFAVAFPQTYNGGNNKTGNLNFVLSSNTRVGNTTQVHVAYGNHQVTTTNPNISFSNSGITFNSAFVQKSKSITINY